jgi:hypothetical protein
LSWPKSEPESQRYDSTRGASYNQIEVIRDIDLQVIFDVSKHRSGKQTFDSATVKSEDLEGLIQVIISTSRISMSTLLTLIWPTSIRAAAF